MAIVNSIVHNADCLEAMKAMSDKAFELAIVDPPYGIGINESIGRRKGDAHSGHKPTYWDNATPTQSYFDELLRVPVNQIVWGGNYFVSLIRRDSACWLMWDKDISEDISFAQCELAWTSFDSSAKKFKYNNARGGKIHPTQKPVALYRWLLKNYAKQGDRILDTHLGSGSSRIACHEAGFDFTGYELDKDYYEAQEARFAKYVSQEKLFTPERVVAVQEAMTL